MRTFIAISALFFFCFFLKAQSTFLVMMFDTIESQVGELNDIKPILLTVNIDSVFLSNNGFLIKNPPSILSEVFSSKAILVNERGKEYFLEISFKDRSILFTADKKTTWFKKEKGSLLVNSYYSVVNVLCFDSESKRKEFKQMLKKPRGKP